MKPYLLLGNPGAWLSVAMVMGWTAAAQAVSLNSSSGLWANPVGGDGTVEFVADSGETRILWGNPLPPTGKSGLGFTGVGTASISMNSPFLVGTLRHFNNTISPPALSAADLSIALDFADLGGMPLNRQFTFNFAIDETTNTAPCIYDSVTPCADKINFASAVASETFTIGVTDYTLKLLGFSNSPTPGTALVSDFVSQENGISTVFLYGELTAVTLVDLSPDDGSPVTSVPEPTAIAPLFLLGLYWIRRRFMVLRT